MHTPTYDESSGRLGSLNGDHSNVFGSGFGEFPDVDHRVDELGDKETKIGTTIVGIKIGGGVVLITDIRASMGYMISSKDVQKVGGIHSTGVLTIAGSASAAQSLISPFRVEVRLYEARHSENVSIQMLSTSVGNLLRSGGFYVAQPILDGADKTSPRIRNIDPADSVPEEEYTVTGPGSQCTLGVLEQEFEDDLSIEEARGVATKTIRSAVEHNSVSGNNINTAVVTKDGVDIQCHQNFEGLE